MILNVTEKKELNAIKKKELNIKIVKCENLAAFDSNGLSDPYVKIKINKKKLFKTHIISINLNPEFNEETR